LSTCSLKGNVTQLFFSFTRLNFGDLGQIKGTNKIWDKRKRRVGNLSLKRKIRICFGVLLLLLFLVFPFLPSVKQFVAIPNQLIAYKADLPMSIPNLGKDITISSNMETHDAFHYPGIDGESVVVYKKSNIPIKKVDVSVLKNKRIVPGGQSVGVQLHTLGVLVVGHHLINRQENDDASPGENANIHVGDVILEMNGNQIEKMEDVKPIVKLAGKNKEKIHVKIKRGQEVIETSLNPVLNTKDNSYQIGLYIRDSATGIGTVSFYDEDSGKYGALGHIISDTDTKKPIEIYNGKIVRSKVTAIEKGNQGVPGEKQASFSMKDQPIGTITKNSPFGIFGKIDGAQLQAIHQQKALPIGLASEVEKGPAEILTVIEGEKVEKFDVNIVNTVTQKHPATKGMVIKVTDKRLLEKTGGIVQGMSGSPIIQNGKLIGAVTHVFVNDPTSGYGVHIEWMLDEAGVDIMDKDDKLAS
jgi:stage IV sporulation protein B